MDERLCRLGEVGGGNLRERTTSGSMLDANESGSPPASALWIGRCRWVERRDGRERLAALAPRVLRAIERSTR